MPKTRWIEYAGERRTLSEWARTAGLNVQTLSARLRRGQALGEALRSPVLSRARCGRMGSFVSGWRD